MRGYSLIELLLVLSITAILATVAALNFLAYQSRKEVDLAHQLLFAGLRDAQSQSFTGEGGLSWGIHLSTNPNGFNVFSYSTGQPCVPGTTGNFVQISSLIRIQIIAPVGISDICFAALTGFWVDNNLLDGVHNVTIQVDRFDNAVTPLMLTVQGNGQISN